MLNIIQFMPNDIFNVSKVIYDISPIKMPCDFIYNGRFFQGLFNYVVLYIPRDGGPLLFRVPYLPFPPIQTFVLFCRIEHV